MICKAVLMKDYFILLVIQGGKHVLDSLLLLLEDPKIWHFRLGIFIFKTFQGPVDAGFRKRGSIRN